MVVLSSCFLASFAFFGCSNADVESFMSGMTGFIWIELLCIESCELTLLVLEVDSKMGWVRMLTGSFILKSSAKGDSLLKRSRCWTNSFIVSFPYGLLKPVSKWESKCAPPYLPPGKVVGCGFLLLGPWYEGSLGEIVGCGFLLLGPWSEGCSHFVVYSFAIGL